MSLGKRGLTPRKILHRYLLIKIRAGRVGLSEAGLGGPVA